jgi:crotonobetainyl-CoA:carnitine CoA-transferase CaiB-like acyl-CoA transferase
LIASHPRPYKTKNSQYLAVLPYWDNHWRTFCDLVGRSELADDERFIDMATRLKNINESYKVTGEIIASRNRDEWLELLGDTNVPMMVVNSLDDLIDDPHLVETGFWQDFEHPTEGQIRMSSPPMNFDKTPASIRRGPPRLGEQTVEILLEAGIEQEKIDQMLASGEARLPAA